MRALKAVDESDVSLLVIDATIGVTHQDQRLAERADAAGCPIVILLNKWELLNTEQREKIGDDVERNSASRKSASPSDLGAVRQGCQPALARVAAGGGRLPHPHPDPRRQQVDPLGPICATCSVEPAVLYATQGATDPPTFTLFVNRELPKTYLRYLERCAVEDFNLGSTPIKLRVRSATTELVQLPLVDLVHGGDSVSRMFSLPQRS